MQFVSTFPSGPGGRQTSRDVSGGTIIWVPAPRKLSDADVAKIRRRVKRGEQLSALAEEFGVNRKTIRRRVDAVEFAEREKAERLASNRIRRQSARELRKLKQRGPQRAASSVRGSGREIRRKSMNSAYYDWLDTPKNLGGRAYAEASGLIKLRTADGKNRRWVERPDAERLLQEGWLLD